MKLIDHNITTNTLLFLVTVNICLLKSTSLRLNNNPKWNFPAIFNFGDSASDTGAYTALKRTLPPPYGETFFSGPATRFSNGRLLIDFLAESLGLPYLNAYLNSVGANFSHGANFAIAGSTIRGEVLVTLVGSVPFVLDLQIYEFTKFRKSSQRSRSKGEVFESLVPKEDYFAKALYTFEIGENDIFNGFALNKSFDEVKAFIPDAVSHLMKAVKDLYEQGGRSFWFHNAGPMGCPPYVFEVYAPTVAQIDKVGCATQYNEVAQFYNDKLKEAIDQLRKELPLGSFTYVDVYSIKYTLFSQAKQLGFEEPSQVACCGHGGKYNFDPNKRCGATEIVDGKEILIAKSCDNPSVKVIWDGIHYTEAANKWIVSQILDNASYVESSINRGIHST